MASFGRHLLADQNRPEIRGTALMKSKSHSQQLPRVYQPIFKLLSFRYHFFAVKI